MPVDMAARVIAALFLLTFCAAATAASRQYDADYVVEFRPKAKAAVVTLTLTPRTGRATRLELGDRPCA